MPPVFPAASSCLTCDSDLGTLRADRQDIRHHPWRAMRQRCFLMLLVLGLLLPPALLRAQDVEWQERRTPHFSILYPAGADATAEQYTRFVDQIYDEAAVLWDYRPPPPVVLRIYPTMELYYEANPIAARLPGVVAHAHTGRREISVAIPQTSGQSPEEIQNNVRHELTHIIAADLSEGRLTTPWQEGIAQFVEHPSADLEKKMELMRQIIAENRLLSWRDLNQPGATYADPRVGYPQSLTMVAFLIQRNGMARFREFVEAMKTSSGYRGALEATYGASADTLEREWRSALPRFVTDGYRSGDGRSLPAAFDLDPAAELVAQGDYDGAVRLLQPLLSAIETGGDAAAAERARRLLARAEMGRRATELASEARNALLQGDYAATITASQAGQHQFNAIGQADQAGVLATYEQLAGRGIAAEAELAEAGTLLRRLQIPEARQHLRSAYTTFVELGNQRRAAQAEAALTMVARGEQLLTALCLIAGIVLIAWSTQRRAIERRMALPFG